MRRAFNWVSRSSPARLVRTRWPARVTNTGWRERARLTGDRLRDAWAAFLGRIRWQIFATLTFDSKLCRNGVNLDLAHLEAFWWCGAVAHVMRRPIGWAYVVERGGGGAWHVHVLLVGVAGVSWGAARAIWETRNGRIDIQPVYERKRIAAYVTKSVDNDVEIVLSDTLKRYAGDLADEIVIDLEERTDEVAVLVATAKQVTFGLDTSYRSVSITPGDQQPSLTPDDGRRHGRAGGESHQRTRATSSRLKCAVDVGCQDGLCAPRRADMVEAASHSEYVLALFQEQDELPVFRGESFDDHVE